MHQPARVTKALYRGELAVAGGNAPVVLEIGEVVFHQVASPIAVPVVFDLDAPADFGRHGRYNAFGGEGKSDLVRIIGIVWITSSV